MQLAIEDSSLEQVVDLIMRKRGYVPESNSRANLSKTKMVLGVLTMKIKA